MPYRVRSPVKPAGGPDPRKTEVRAWRVATDLKVDCLSEIVRQFWLLACGLAMAASVLLPYGACRPLMAAPPPAELPFVAPAEQAAVDELDRILREGAIDEAVDRCLRLIDESGERLVKVASSYDEPLERFLPLRLVVQDRILRWGQIRGELLSAYRQQTDAGAQQQFREAQDQRETGPLLALVQTAWASSVADDALLELADRDLEAGRPSDARRWLERIDARWHALAAPSVAADVSRGGIPPALPLDAVLNRAEAQTSDQWPPQLLGSVVKDGQDAARRTPIGVYIGSDLSPATIAVRWVLCACLEGDLDRARRAVRWIEATGIEGAVEFGGRTQPVANALTQLLDDAAQWPPIRSREEWTTFGGDPTRGKIGQPLEELSASPTWMQELRGPVSEGLAAQRAQAAELRRAVPAGEPIGGLLLFPVAVEGRLWLQQGPEVRSFGLRDGTVWATEGAPPTAGTRLAEIAEEERGLVFRAEGRWSEWRLSEETAVVGLPRYSLSADNGSIWARVGPAITGWYGIELPTGSQSQLVGLDARAEGRLLDGWPMNLSGQRWIGYEFDGGPLAMDGRLYAPLLRRDKARIDVHVAAIDQATGQLLWVTPLLFGSRPLDGTQAQRVSHNLLSSAGDQLFIQSHLGACAAIDRHTGQTRWIVRYPRVGPGESQYAGADRQRFRDLTPPMVVNDLVILAPADSDRIWALRANDGQLVWASGAEQAADVTHLLGAVDGTLLASGDQLYWIDLLTGDLLAVFPGNGGFGPQPALPDPRGLGRGVVAGSSVYWPTADSIYVFRSRLDEFGMPHVQQVLDLQAVGLTGGSNLLVSEGVLAATGQEWVAAWVGESTHFEDRRQAAVRQTARASDNGPVTAPVGGTGR